MYLKVKHLDRVNSPLWSSIRAQWMVMAKMKVPSTIRPEMTTQFQNLSGVK